jgi:hypothetical protein
MNTKEDQNPVFLAYIYVYMCVCACVRAISRPVINFLRLDFSIEAPCHDILRIGNS